MTVSIGINNQVEASEAARVLGCAYSSVISLLSHKKLKGQKYEGKWMVDYTDLQRAKTTNLIKPRARNLKIASSNSQTEIEEHILANKVNVQISIEKDKLRLIEIGLQGSNHTVVEFIHMKLEEMHTNVKEALKNIKI